jgi:hypothetical protein
MVQIEPLLRSYDPDAHEHRISGMKGHEDGG